MNADNRRGEMADVKMQLGQLAGSRAPGAAEMRRELFKKVISHMTIGIDVSSVFSEMVMCSAASDLVVKKMCYLYVATYAATKPELALLTINFLQRDCQDDDPMIRGLALRNLCALRVRGLVEYLVGPLERGLGDVSAYVRAVAVMGVLKLYHLAPAVCREHGYIGMLKRKLTDDPDAQVVANCVSALQEILAGESLAEDGDPEAVRDRDMLHSRSVVFALLNRMKEMSEWAQCTVLDLASRYTPAHPDEAFDLMNLLEDRLQHANSAVVLATAKLFLHLTLSMPDVHHQVYERIKTPLLTLVGTCSTEQSYAVLCHLSLLVSRCPSVFAGDYKHLYCKVRDPPYVKRLKLQMLTAIANDSNTYDIVTELTEYAADVDVSIAREAIRAVGQIALQSYDVNGIVDRLLQFLEMDTDYVTAETLVLVRDLLRKYPQWAQDCIAVVGSVSSRSVTDPRAKAALVWMLGEYGQHMGDAPYTLEGFVNSWEEETNAEVRLELLTAVAKLFFKRPPECQKMLGAVLAHGLAESQQDVHDRALLYYRLLRAGVGVAEQVINPKKQPVSVFVDSQGSETRDRIFDEFNSLSVVYQKPAYLSGFDSIDSLLGLAAPSPAPGGGAGLEDMLSGAHAPVRPALVLSAKASLDAPSFQRTWSQLPVAATLEEKLPGTFITALSAPAPLLRHMAHRNIQCMASGGQRPAFRFFFYAQKADAAPGGMFLVELQVNTNAGTASGKVKGAAGAADEFAALFRDALLHQPFGTATSDICTESLIFTMRHGPTIVILLLLGAFLLAAQPSIASRASTWRNLNRAWREGGENDHLEAPSQENSGTFATPAADGSAVYIVRLSTAPPLSEYRGGIAGYPATATWDDGSDEEDSDAVAAYAGLLQRQQAQVASEAGVPEDGLLYSYKHTSNGFAARLTRRQLWRLQRHPAVASVRASRVFSRQTSDSPQFLGLPGKVWPAVGGQSKAGEGTVVGIVDSGIWPEHPSFSDKGFSSQLPAGWKGKCEQSSSFRCNNKLIGAKAFYSGFQQSIGRPVLTNDWLTPRDADGHGTWCAGAAAGNPVNVKGGGQVNGMAPAARIAAYKVFWTDGNGELTAMESDIIAAVNQGVADGVDVLSLSLGSKYPDPNDHYFNDLAFMRANAAGVFVTFAAGNNGPPGRGGNYRTLDNFAPFYLTVGASSIARGGVSLVSSTAGTQSLALGATISSNGTGGDFNGNSTDGTDGTDGSSSSTVLTADGGITFTSSSSSAPVVADFSSRGPLLQPSATAQPPMAALMTTARVTDTSKSAIKSSTGGEATPWEMGAGHVFPPAMLDPGLTYDARDRDYQNFLAGQDLNRAKKEFPGVALSPLAVRNLNLPTITLPRLQGSLQVTRTVTNVGQSRSTYSVSGKAPQGVKVTVSSKSLTLAPREKATYTLTITVDTPSNDVRVYSVGRQLGP
ncbi:unnamed protein product [Closterium sp. Yama58-4]|nr:unnamed protein product [Closterium sp. Yama58-4]